MFSHYKEYLIEPLKKLWKNKHIIICEGRFSCVGVYNDLFAYWRSIQRIWGANQNAFLEYRKLRDYILEKVSKYSYDDVFILCALGHTSKILMMDLYKQGYKNIFDIGNLSIAYDSYLHSFPQEWIDNPVQTICYPPKHYGFKLKEVRE